MFHQQLSDFAFLRQISRFCSLDFDNSQHGKPFSKSDLSVSYLSRIECDSYPLSIRSSLLVCLHREPYLATCKLSTVVLLELDSTNFVG